MQRRHSLSLRLIYVGTYYYNGWALALTQNFVDFSLGLRAFRAFEPCDRMGTWPSQYLRHGFVYVTLGFHEDESEFSILQAEASNVLKQSLVLDLEFLPSGDETRQASFSPPFFSAPHLFLLTNPFPFRVFDSLLCLANILENFRWNDVSLSNKTCIFKARFGTSFDWDFDGIEKAEYSVNTLQTYNRALRSWEDEVWPFSHQHRATIPEC
ncbi:hypothetical protein VNO77_03694 [Canavalia gladiata]|uniref:Uncharacterized protein n=1 Tax=Canavalia gladiata TaxID=3824 RepID=A0AAN9RCH1_CANGL